MSDTKESSQPCGCDPGINWVCSQHKLYYALSSLIREWRGDAATMLSGTEVQQWIGKTLDQCADEVEDLINA